MKSETSSLKTIIKELVFLKKTFFFLLLTNKLIERIPDPCDAKEHYE